MILPTGPVRPVTTSRSTPRSAPGSLRVPRSQSTGGSVCDTPTSGAGDNVRRASEKAATELHTRINEDQKNQDEESFAALERILKELLCEKFSGEVEQLVTISKNAQTVERDVKTVLYDNRLE